MVILIISIFCSNFLLKLLLPSLNKNLIDKPNQRSSHTSPCITGGGVAFIIVHLAISIFLSNYNQNLNSTLNITMSCLPLAIVGFIDDYKGVRNYIRFSIQIIVSILIIYSSNIVQIENNFILSSVVYIFLAITSCTVINFTNFMDGLDGLVAGCMTVIFIVCAISINQSNSILALIGALIGFLFLNWHPAKVFMGDVGSTYLGAIYIGFVYLSTTWDQALGLILVSTPLMSDALICLIRRFISKQSIFKAHKLHLYQRLHQAGLSHNLVSIIYILGCIAMGIAFLGWGLKASLCLAFVEIFVGYLLDRRVATAFY